MGSREVVNSGCSTNVSHPNQLHMVPRYASLLALCCSSFAADAQYCSPNFANGCFNWYTQTVDIAELSWEATDCNASDQTDLSATVVAGVAMPMTVVNANWCGCAIWVDLDDNGDFSSNEELFHLYGNMETATYDLDLLIPESTTAGPHRMRIISGWGSDGVSEGPNGYGPCGDYQYGNHVDFTLNVEPASAIDEPAVPVRLMGMNPTTGPVVLASTEPLDAVLVRTVDGRLVRAVPANGQAGSIALDLTGLVSGQYILECRSGKASGRMRVIKE